MLLELLSQEQYEWEDTCEWLEERELNILNPPALKKKSQKPPKIWWECSEIKQRTTVYEQYAEH